MNDLSKAIRALGLVISIVVIPKTIDNDLPIIDKSFGYDSACEEAIKFIDSANIEAEAAENGLGLVKVMGRNSGYIAMASTLASRDVNICIVPEIHVELEGEHGLYHAVMERILNKGHICMVISEGCE